MIVCDQTHSVSRHFNIIQSNNDTNRAVFIIDKTRKIRFSFVIEDDRISHSMNTICSIVSILYSFLFFIFTFLNSCKHFNKQKKLIYSKHIPLSCDEFNQWLI